MTNNNEPKALNWRQIAALTEEQLDALLETEGEDVYDDVTINLAQNEYDNRMDEADQAADRQAIYDDYWRTQR